MRFVTNVLYIGMLLPLLNVGALSADLDCTASEVHGMPVDGQPLAHQLSCTTDEGVDITFDV
jgi:hypothetical protein